MAFSLSRAQRVRKRSEFLLLQASSAKVSTRHLVMLFGALQRQTTAPPARLGVVASRKVGNAVARNRAKRLVREVFRRHPELFPPGIDVAMVIRAGAAELSFDALEAEVIGAARSIARRAEEVARAPIASQQSSISDLRPRRPRHKLPEPREPS